VVAVVAPPHPKQPEVSTAGLGDDCSIAEEPAVACEVCHKSLLKVFPNQTRHPLCLYGEPWLDPAGGPEDPVEAVQEFFPGAEVIE